MTTSWRTVTSTTEQMGRRRTRATAPENESVMLETSQQAMMDARRRGARRTALIVAGIALVVFALSFLQMVR